jgi:hypothetical protein
MTNRSKGWLWTREVVSLPARSQDASAEHNDWQSAGQLDDAAWKALAGGRLTAADYLEMYARNHGHRLALPRHGTTRRETCPACGALADQERDGTLLPHQRPAQDWPARFIPCAGRPPRRR